MFNYSQFSCLTNYIFADSEDMSYMCHKPTKKVLPASRRSWCLSKKLFLHLHPLMALWMYEVFFSCSLISLTRFMYISLLCFRAGSSGINELEKRLAALRNPWSQYLGLVLVEFHHTQNMIPVRFMYIILFQEWCNASIRDLLWVINGCPKATNNVFVVW